MITRIDSANNNLIKHIRKLSSSKYRKECGEYFTEGLRSVNDALLSDAEISSILVSESFDLEKLKYDIKERAPLYVVSDSVFNSIKDTVNSQGIIAVAKIKEVLFEDENLDDKNLVLYLDCVTDPGNLGTIIRTADACGIGGIILSKGCVDMYSPKVVRSTMSSLFNVPVYKCESAKSAFEHAKRSGFTCVATSLDTDNLIYDINFTKKTMIVIGNEANGITDEVMSLCTQFTKIPMFGKLESLNAAVASSVIMYEAVRQKIKG